MAETTKIQWADMTWNPWIGCTKVSAGCKNCYAENTTRARVLRGQGHETWGKGAERSRTSEAYWKKALNWDAECAVHPGCGNKVFPSLCDWLDDEVPVEWLADFLKLIHQTENLRWLLLTKRPQNYFERIEDAVNILANRATDGDAEAANAWSTPDEQHVTPSNVWIGTSCEDQYSADERIPALISIPASIRFISVEPLIFALDLQGGEANAPRHMLHDINSIKTIDWVIVGGESGPGARPCETDWIREIVRQCKRSKIACFVKQIGRNPVWNQKEMSERWYEKLSHPKGGDPEEWPADLRVREFPMEVA